jgi:hypothetical protein
MVVVMKMVFVLLKFRNHRGAGDRSAGIIKEIT